MRKWWVLQMQQYEYCIVENQKNKRMKNYETIIAFMWWKQMVALCNLQNESWLTRINAIISIIPRSRCHSLKYNCVLIHDASEAKKKVSQKGGSGTNATSAMHKECIVHAARNRNDKLKQSKRNSQRRNLESLKITPQNQHYQKWHIVLSRTSFKRLITSKF